MEFPSLGEEYTSVLHLGLGHVTCFGRQDASRPDTNRGFQRALVRGHGPLVRLQLRLGPASVLVRVEPSPGRPSLDQAVPATARVLVVLF